MGSSPMERVGEAMPARSNMAKCPSIRSMVETSKNKSCVLSLREVATGRVRFDRDVRSALMGRYDVPPAARG